MNRFLVVALVICAVVGTILWEMDRALPTEVTRDSVDSSVAVERGGRPLMLAGPYKQVVAQLGYDSVSRDDPLAPMVQNPIQLVETLGGERGKRLPNGAFETPEIEEVRSMYEGLKDSNMGDRAPESWDSFMTQMEHGAALAEELSDLAKQDQLKAEAEERDLRANGRPEEIQLWEHRKEKNGMRLEILAGLNQEISDRTADYNKSRPIEDWVNGLLPASMATPEVDPDVRPSPGVS
jgi:hypothetical protein